MKPAGIQMRKAALRDELRQSLADISKKDRRRKSLAIYRRVSRTTCFRRARQILLYCALPSEVNTDRLIRDALRLNKDVLLPRIDRNRGVLIPVKITSLDGLKRGAFGIREPKTSSKTAVSMRGLDLIIAPGLGFDRRGGRLGRGAGFFDRLLKKAINATVIGLAFKEQIRKKIPMASHDVYVDRVITD